MEKEVVQESESQQKNQSAGVSGNGHVGATIWSRDLDSNPARHQETEDFPNEMPPGHCGCDSVGYAAQCGHTGGDWRATNERAAETEEAPVVRTPAEDARPSATEATAAVQTEKKEETTRRDLLALGGCHQQRPDGDPTMARCGDRQKCMA